MYANALLNLLLHFVQRLSLRVLALKVPCVWDVTPQEAALLLEEAQRVVHL